MWRLSLTSRFSKAIEITRIINLKWSLYLFYLFDNARSSGISKKKIQYYHQICKLQDDFFNFYFGWGFLFCFYPLEQMIVFLKRMNGAYLYGSK